MATYRDGLGDETGRRIVHVNGWLEYRYGPGGTCEMTNMLVEPQFRRMGFARDMVDELEADPRVKTLYGFTQAHNTEAHAAFRKLGFTLLLVPDFYGAGKDAFLITKTVR